MFLFVFVLSLEVSFSNKVTKNNIEGHSIKQLTGDRVVNTIPLGLDQFHAD